MHYQLRTIIKLKFTDLNGNRQQMNSSKKNIKKVVSRSEVYHKVILQNFARIQQVVKIARILIQVVNNLHAAFHNVESANRGRIKK